MAAPQTQQLRLGEVLLESGTITEDQLNKALDLQKSSPQRKRLGEVLIENGMITEDRIKPRLRLVSVLSMYQSATVPSILKQLLSSLKLSHLNTV